MFDLHDLTHITVLYVFKKRTEVEAQHSKRLRKVQLIYLNYRHTSNDLCNIVLRGDEKYV
jgi:hypothetical protein